MPAIKVLGSKAAASQFVASAVLKTVAAKSDAVLGLATGGTMESIYAELVKQANAEQVSMAGVQSFNLDEYVGLKGDHEQSYRHYMNAHLFSHLDFDQARLHLPNGAAENAHNEATCYEAAIRASHVDLQLLGIGHNGHIGFNEPGSAFDSPTRVIDLTERTREANAMYFASKADVPSQAITMGIGTIMAAKRIVLVAFGEGKAEIVARALQGDVSEDCPASILQQHPDVTFVLDEAAALDLSDQAA